MKNKNTTPDQPNYARRRVVAGGGVVALLAAGAIAGNKAVDRIHEIRENNHIYNQTTDPDAMQHYVDGDIDPSKVTVVVADKTSTPGRFANDINGEGDWRSLADVIASQDDANGIDGVQAGEKFVVPLHKLDESYQPRFSADQAAPVSKPEPKP